MESDQIIEQANPDGTIDIQHDRRYFLRYLPNNLACFTVNDLQDNRSVVQVYLEMEIVANPETGDLQILV